MNNISQTNGENDAGVERKTFQDKEGKTFRIVFRRGYSGVKISIKVNAEDYHEAERMAASHGYADEDYGGKVFSITEVDAPKRTA